MTLGPADTDFHLQLEVFKVHTPNCMMLIKRPPTPPTCSCPTPLSSLPFPHPSALRLANMGAWSRGSPHCHCSQDFPGTLGTHPRGRQSQVEAKMAWSPAEDARDDRAWKAPSCPAQFFSEGVVGGC